MNSNMNMLDRRRRAFYLGEAAIFAAFLAAACDSAPTAPSAAATITISSAGVMPREVRIRRWDRITFVNNDTRPHSIVSDPIDVHSECPPVNRVGFLQPGESRDTGALELSGTCGFHDHINQSDAGLRGRIIVE
jgi:plastocyanin